MAGDGSSFVKAAVQELTVEEILAKARPSERTVSVCVRGDLNARFEDLERQLKDARESERGEVALGESGRARAIAEEMETVRAEMRDAQVTFRLRAMPPKQWVELRAAHMDDGGRLNVQTLGPPLVAASLYSPKVTAAQLDSLLEVLTGGQYDELVSAAIVVNQGTVDVPFSQLASLVLRPPDSEQS
jgi:hypothetical protein